MKKLFIPLLAASLSISAATFAQSSSDVGSAIGAAINLTGDTGTEQAAKLELIRILQERLNKLTVTQLNSRIIVSQGVSKYYKVAEIFKMNEAMYGYRSKYVGIAQKLEAGNPGFTAHAGNGFAYKYMIQLNEAVSKADAIYEQTKVVITSGKPIILPAMPTFNISPSANDPAASMADDMKSLLSSYGVNSKEEFDALPQAKQDEIKGKANEIGEKFKEKFKDQIKSQNGQTLAMIGNVVGAVFGVPGAGNLISGLVSGGGGKAAAALVGTIMDQFQIPTDYYDSGTLKLTDAERIKMIDELHVRMSDLYQQISALGASLSSETKVRYNELAAPRNEQIMHGQKK